MFGETMPEPGLMERFKSKAREFAVAYKRLLSLREEVELRPQLQAEYNSLVKRGEVLRQTVANITGTIDRGWEWFTSVFGLGAVDYARDRAGQLGAIPVILGAATIGSFLLFINSVYQFERKLDTLKKLENEGKISPAQMVKSFDDKSMFKFPGKPALWLLIGGTTLFLYALKR